MNSVSQITYFLRKSPLVRTLCIILFIAVFMGVSFFITFKIKQNPQISSITPPIGTPGDLVIIKGKDFGENKNTSYVEFGGSRLTASSYISWSDTEIKLVLPANIQDGLVFVGTKDARSKPVFFANATSVPVALLENPLSTVPTIHTLIPNEKSATRAKVGDLLIIQGINFGNTREKSRILFSTDRESVVIKDSNSYTAIPSEHISYIPANEDDFDYEYWSDSEIRVRIPDGCTTGNVYVETTKGNSVPVALNLDRKIGSKKYLDPKTYVIQVKVDIEDYSSDKDSTIILRCPRPFVTASQPSIEITEYDPEPVIEDFQHTVIHQSSFEKNHSNKKNFYQNFAITVYETATNIDPLKVGTYSKTSDAILEVALNADDCVSSEDEEVVALAKKIIQKDKNPYTKAKAIYNYMLKNFVILQDLRTGNISPVDLIRSKKGDAYDFAITYTALLRAAGVPAIPNSGIIIDAELKTKNHWWSEFYIHGIGWIPVDVALAAGLDYNSWVKELDAKSYYFGNLDGQHIVFSRGWNDIKPGPQNNKTVYRPRSYALQSIWEEASGKVIKYSSYWADPIVIGVY